MQHVKDVTSPLKVGEIYLVDTVKIRQEPKHCHDTDAGIYTQRETIYIVPVLGSAHKDGQTSLHMHLDQRFMGKKLMRKFGIALFLDAGDLPVVARPMACVRSRPVFPVLISRHREVYKNAKMKNWTCPHQGAYLGNVERVDGCVTCPMHGLSFNCETGEQVETPDNVLWDIQNFRKLIRLGRAVIARNGTIKG